MELNPYLFPFHGLKKGGFCVIYPHHPLEADYLGLRCERKAFSLKRNETLKAVALDSDLDIEVSRAHRALFDGNAIPFWELVERYGYEVIKVCLNINSSRRKRALRCRQKVGKAIETDNCFFLTLTFTDDVLSGTSEKTRRRYVARYLKEIAPLYVANIDYGDKEKNPESNEREHYHALVVSGVRPKRDGWPYGFSKIKKVGNTESDLIKISKYTAKLSHHALKASTLKGAPKCPRLIYSRNCVR